MNYLQICQALRRECRIAGTGPSTVVGQTGLLGDLVAWANQSYTEIQNLHKGMWRWLRHSFTLSTTASDGVYAYGDCTDSTTAAAITRLSHWRFEDPYDPPKIYLTASGVGTETWLTYVPWEVFKSLYRIGTQNDGFPAHISVDPQNNIVLGPVPDDAYTVTADYYRSAQTLSLDADEPEMPSQYHYLIVYRAMEKYGYGEVAQEVIARGEREASKMQRQLDLNQLPSVRLGAPMA